MKWSTMSDLKKGLSCVIKIVCIMLGANMIMKCMLETGLIMK